MAEPQDNAQRTEEPTQKRMDDARKKGDAPKSVEVTTTIMLALSALAFWFLIGSASQRVGMSMIGFVERPHALSVKAGDLIALFNAVTITLFIAMIGVFCLLALGAILGNIVQARPVFTLERMKPTLSKLSPVAGVKRVFGPSGLVNFAKGFGKLVIVGTILCLTLWADRNKFVTSVGADSGVIMISAMGMLLKLMIFTILSMAVIAGLDLMWQRHSWRQKLRMTREEVRRELKESDGDPHIKARQRQLRDAQSRRRMTAAVKEATVVIMNPTHYAVALRYDTDESDAPVCTAKGMDDLALRMRQIARDNSVPVIENPPLARALHATAKLDEQIPVEHYEAVAKVIGFVLSKAKAATRV